MDTEWRICVDLHFIDTIAIYTFCWCYIVWLCTWQVPMRKSSSILVSFDICNKFLISNILQHSSDKHNFFEIYIFNLMPWQILPMKLICITALKKKKKNSYKMNWNSLPKRKHFEFEWLLYAPQKIRRWNCKMDEQKPQSNFLIP